MNGRRRKDEPFNPFAPNASQKARDRKEKSHRPATRQRTPEPAKPVNDLASKQRAAMEALRRRKEVEDEKSSSEKSAQKTEVVPKHKPSPQPKPAPKTSIKKPESRADRLASLRAKSAATAQFAKDAQDAKKSVESVEPELAELPVEEIIPDAIEDLVVDEPIIETQVARTHNPKNVFKTIKTEKKKAERKPKRRRADKKGGGRQPQSRKLDRRKYLEYKYAARELLDIDEVSEEHRSNILGQIWAKGERIGVADAVDFINQKEAELIIPERVADEFRKMVKRYTTKR